jgi:hypothetical protein
MNPKPKTLAHWTGWLIARARQALGWFSCGCDAYMAWSGQAPIVVSERP